MGVMVEGGVTDVVGFMDVVGVTDIVGVMDVEGVRDTQVWDTVQEVCPKPDSGN